MVKHQSIRQIVDIFRGAGEVQILLLRLQVCIRGKSLFQEVLNCLDVMIRGTLNFFDALCICNGELSEHGVHEGLLSGHLLDGRGILRDDALVEQGLEPAELDVDAEAHKGELREVGPQRVAALGIAAVNGTDRRQWTDLCNSLGIACEVNTRLHDNHSLIAG